MTTTPTQLPIPSEKPQDLKFNAGKIDEFATSTGFTYADRFGVNHYTIEGLKNLAEQAIKAFGYITIDSFEDGATLTLPNQILRWKSNGEYYRWDGAFPKPVSSGSTPNDSGGIGLGAWISVGDGALRSQISDPDGATKYPELQMSRWRDEGDARGWGLKADGETDNSAFLNEALQSGKSEITIPEGVSVFTQKIVIPAGVTLRGQGIDYWDTYRPAPGRLLKSWSKGTHLLFKGTGEKSNSFLNLSNARDYKQISGTDVPFTEFTNRDSVNGAPATAKPMSVAVTATHGSQIKNLRIMLNNNGIDGYNSTDPSLKGDEWDIGLWVYDGNSFNLENVQVVGYWKKISTLVTENDGSYTMVGNPESAIFNSLYTQGMRGLAIRNSPQWDVTAYTSTSVTCKYNSSWTLTSQNNFRISGSFTLFSFEGYTVSGNSITLTGVSPPLTSLPASVRAPNIGNNFSGTSFNNSKVCSLDHTSGQSSASLGLGRAASIEIDGFPVRNLKFENFKSQTSYDDINAIFGGMNDAKFLNSEFENGALIAYTNTETIGYTGNLRMFNTDIQSSVNIEQFNPRDCFQDYRQIPTSQSTGVAVFKNWRAKGLEVQYSNGSYGLMLRDSDNNIQISNGNGFIHMVGQGSNNSLQLKCAAFTLRNSADVAMLTGFDTTNMTWAASLSGPTLAVSTAVRGTVANSALCGTPAQPWAGGNTQVAFTITSDINKKQDFEAFTEEELDAWGDVDWQKFRLINEVSKHGKDAEYHSGLIAQEVMAVFLNHGLDAGTLGVVQYNYWDESTDDDGTITEAGDLYTLNYTEALCIEAAWNRRELRKMKEIIREMQKNMPE